MLKKLFSLKAVLLATGLSLAICLFLGCFANAPADMHESFSGKYWYYINRGYPEAWAGVALTNSEIAFPLVQLPFLSLNEKGITFVKIVDLIVFAPLFITVFLFSYIPAYIFAKAVEENKQLSPFFATATLVIFVLATWIYFTWFSRI